MYLSFQLVCGEFSASSKYNTSVYFMKELTMRSHNLYSAVQLALASRHCGPSSIATVRPQKCLDLGR